MLQLCIKPSGFLLFVICKNLPVLNRRIENAMHLKFMLKNEGPSAAPKRYIKYGFFTDCIQVVNCLFQDLKFCYILERPIVIGVQISGNLAKQSPTSCEQELQEEKYVTTSGGAVCRSRNRHFTRRRRRADRSCQSASTVGIVGLTIWQDFVLD